MSSVCFVYVLGNYIVHIKKLTLFQYYNWQPNDQINHLVWTWCTDRQPYFVLQKHPSNFRTHNPFHAAGHFLYPSPFLYSGFSIPWCHFGIWSGKNNNMLNKRKIRVIGQHFEMSIKGGERDKRASTVRIWRTASRQD